MLSNAAVSARRCAGSRRRRIDECVSARIPGGSLVALAFRPFQIRHLHPSEDHACESSQARVHAFPDRGLGTPPAGPRSCAQRARVAVPLGGGRPRLLHRTDWQIFCLCRDCLAELWKDECA